MILEIPLNLANQIRQEDGLFKDEKHNVVLVNAEEFDGDYEKTWGGELYLTNDYFMFLCSAPWVDERNIKTKVLDEVTRGWSAFVRVGKDEKKAQTLEAMVLHPYSFLVPPSSIVHYERQERKKRFSKKETYLRFDVLAEEGKVIPYCLMGPVAKFDKWLEAFGKAKS